MEKDPYTDSCVFQAFQDPNLPEEALPSYLDTLPDALPTAPMVDEAVDSQKMMILVLNMIFGSHKLACFQTHYQ